VTIFPQQILKRNVPGSNPRLRCERPATNSLSHGRDLIALQNMVREQVNRAFPDLKYSDGSLQFSELFQDVSMVRTFLEGRTKTSFCVFLLNPQTLRRD
jgi:hypothetical protein